MARSRRTLLLLALLAPAAAAQGDGDGPDVAALFARNCAACHGLDGSGTGPSVLDRPARNFKEGGFSFGNTPEAIARTIAHGIPGSPMPAFEASLSEAERRALAEYVVTLGPPIKEVSEAETLMVVRDKPLVVRGILPPLVEGGPKIPRGLLIGTPDGLTFEYDVEDVRLVAVRAGEFVKRTDWGGRGGQPLEPLGKVVWSEDVPQRPWLATRLETSRDMGQKAVAQGELATSLRATVAGDEGPTVAYTLTWGPDSKPLASVAEVLRSSSALGHAGFSRVYAVHAVQPEWRPEELAPVVLLTVSPVTWDDWDVHPGLSAKGNEPLGESPRYWAHVDEGGVAQILQLTATPGSESISASASAEGLMIKVPLWTESAAFEVGTYIVPDWTPALAAELEAANE